MHATHATISTKPTNRQNYNPTQVSSGDPRGKSIAKIDTKFEIVERGWKGSLVSPAKTADISTTAASVVLDCNIGQNATMSNIITERAGDLAVTQVMQEPLALPLPTLRASCMDAPCLAGSLAADAMQELTSADVALLPSSAIIQQGKDLDEAALAHGPVTRSLLSELYSPDDEIVLVSNMPGACIAASIAASLDSIATSGPMQVSGTLRALWHLRGTGGGGKRILRKIEIWTGEVWVALDPTGVYSVATTASVEAACKTFLENSEAAGAGLAATPRGVIVAEGVAMYLDAKGSEADQTLRDLVVNGEQKEWAFGSNAYRLWREADVKVLQLGSLCSLENTQNLEECHQTAHVARLINDKTDGFYDDLLPTAYLDIKMENSGCAEGLAQDALKKTRKRFHDDTPGSEEKDSLYGIIGPFCSDDVKDVSGRGFRNLIDWQGVVISAGSTAPELGTTDENDREYPNMARIAIPETHLSNGLRSIVANNEWKKVAVISDDSLWGRGAAASFIKTMKADVLGAEILNDGNTELVNLDEWDAADQAAVEAKATAILEDLERLDAKIIYIAVQTRISREIFRYGDNISGRRILPRSTRGHCWVARTH